MIEIKNEEVMGWDAAIRGMRNPMNSWDKSDSGWNVEDRLLADDIIIEECSGLYYAIGPNDYDLMKRLRNAGTDHRKYMRMITVYADITAPLYWWKEYDTYKVSTVANSCSTMHKIHDKEFTLDDFSSEHLFGSSLSILSDTINELNDWREIYHGGGVVYDRDGTKQTFEPKSKDAWWQMIQLLPSSYNQKRTVMLNYEVLANMYKSRKSHKLDEWRTFCQWIESLPLSELIIGEKRGEPAEAKTNR